MPQPCTVTLNKKSAGHKGGGGLFKPRHYCNFKIVVCYSLQQWGLLNLRHALLLSNSILLTINGREGGGGGGGGGL